MLIIPDASSARKRVVVQRDSLKIRVDSIQKAFLSIKQQYDAENEKAYLKQKYDTARLFQLNKSLLDAANALDAADVAKNKVPKLRKKNSSLLVSYRLNLFNAGNFYLRKGKNKEAYEYYDNYIETAKMPLFEDYDFAQNDSLMPRVAFWAVVAASLDGKPERVLPHTDMAYQWVRKEQVLQFKAQALKVLYGENNEGYLQTLKKGFDMSPEYMFFFNNLITYYTDNNYPDSVIQVCDKALSNDVLKQENKRRFLYVKSSILLNKEKYDECIVLCEQIITIDSLFAPAYYNAGLSYLKKSELTDRKERKAKRAMLNLSRTYLENFRKMAPKEREKWGPLLYQVYFGLNLGKKFSEIDEIL